MTLLGSGRSVAVLLAGLLCQVSPAFAASARLSVTATVVTPIFIPSVKSLTFRRVVAGTGGTVTVDPRRGRIPSGGVTLAADAPAVIQVAGVPNSVFSVSLPGNGSVTLGDDPASNLVVPDFVTATGSGGTLGSSGTGEVSLGATLKVSAGQSPGSYAGSFQVSVDYN
jgi:hypothetical protein